MLPGRWHVVQAIVVDTDDVDQAVLVQAETPEELEVKLQGHFRELLRASNIKPEGDVEDQAKALHEGLMVYRSTLGEIQCI